jgi:hypothetical protein
MVGILVSVGREAAGQIVNILTEYGDVGMVGSDLFAIRTDESIDNVKNRILTAFPDVSHVLVASVSGVAYKGDGAISYSANLLRNTD